MAVSKEKTLSSSQVITIAALTGGVNTPSSRFRLRQYVSRLSQKQIEVREHIPYFHKSCGLPSAFKAAARIPAIFRSRSADLVWIGKELVQGYETFERLLKRPRVMDVDDAIWLNLPLGRLATPDIARAMDAVIVGNNYLAEFFSRYCPNIYVLPTAIDLDRYEPRPDLRQAEAEKFVIGWTGLACNYKYLMPIEPVLQRFLREHDRAELMLLSNRTWKSKLLPAEKIRFVPWSTENEAGTLHSMSVGIMPLTDDKWTRGKCSFKMLQYMAVGLPVVVSPVGMNKEILAKGQPGLAAADAEQWFGALEALYNDWNLQKTMGQAGRKIVERFYSADVVADELAKIFKSIAGG